MSAVQTTSIGIVGGGQLGRMLASAARRLGLGVEVLDPDPRAPAAALADRHHRAAFSDLAAAEALAARVDVVTFEFENVPAAALAQLERLRPVRPSHRVLAICRQRIEEKGFLSSAGFPVAPYRPIHNSQDLERALTELQGPTILKTAEFGYDGKGQVRIHAPDQAAQAYASIAGRLAVLEQVVPFERELSVIVARTPQGATAVYPPFENQHKQQVLDLTRWPARIAPEVSQAAERLAVEIAERLGVIGLLCVELFQVGPQLIVNELAPRPHNSGHLTLEAAETDQFEQHLRAVLGWPLGSTAARGPAAMANLLGDLWQGAAPDLSGCLSDRGVHLHLYGKAEARAGRKMGHLTVLDPDPAKAVERAIAARQRFGRL
jgi:5-(carboxyamino)imidazole ribonucleotide synthase